MHSWSLTFIHSHTATFVFTGDTVTPRSLSWYEELPGLYGCGLNHRLCSMYCKSRCIIYPLSTICVSHLFWPGLVCFVLHICRHSNARPKEPTSTDYLHSSNTHTIIHQDLTPTQAQDTNKSWECLFWTIKKQQAYQRVFGHAVANSVGTESKGYRVIAQ